jgi:DNA repair exonuclease SbcCD ATPase subunit
MSKALRILNLYAENFKRLKVVDITPDGDLIPIVGKNEQGKTSTLDAIAAALQWRAVSKSIPQPIHEGSDKGQTIIDLGEYVVHRTFNASGTTSLKVTTKAGDVIQKPQAILDGLMGDLSFDPLEFSRKSPKEQRELIASLLKQTVGLDISRFEAEYATSYDMRTNSKRDLVRLRGQLDAIKAPTDSDPSDEVDIADLTAELQRRMEAEREQARLDARWEETQRIVGERERAVAAAEEELNEALRLNEEAFEATRGGPKVESVTEVQSQISSMEETNRRAREVKQYSALQADLTSLEKDIEKCTAQMQLAQISKDEAIEDADLPIEGLGITEDGITINDIPFSQCSAAQRLKTSMAIAMMANPTVRVILIRDGSLLDEDNMSVIEEMAGDNDFQLWVECVGTDEGTGVYIEDGEVAN